MMSSNLERVLHFIELWKSRDLNALLAEMTEDCFYHNIPWPPMNGHTEIAAGLSAFLGDASEIEWLVHHAAESASGVVLTERVDRFKIGDRWIELPVMGTFELRDGKIARWRDYFDSAQFQAAMAGG